MACEQFARGARIDDARVDTRRRLLEAAIETFAVKGFYGTTTRDIATAAGLSAAGVYVFYSSKEDLFYQIALHGHTQLLERLRGAASTANEPMAQFEAIMYALTLWHTRWHTRARVVNHELGVLTPPHLRVITGIRREIEALMGSVIDQGVQSGVFNNEDPRITTVAVLSLAIDVARWYREGGRLTPEQVAKHYTMLGTRMLDARMPPSSA